MFQRWENSTSRRFTTWRTWWKPVRTCFSSKSQSIRIKCKGSVSYSLSYIHSKFWFNFNILILIIVNKSNFWLFFFNESINKTTFIMINQFWHFSFNFMQFIQSILFNCRSFGILGSSASDREWNVGDCNQKSPIRRWELKMLTFLIQFWELKILKSSIRFWKL
jgi:hypothetical protein